MNYFTAFAVEERALIRGKHIAHSTLASLRNWFPVTLSQSPDNIWWRHVAEKRFTEPFFADTLTNIDYQQRLVCHTPLTVLETLPPGIQPTAFIFHISRCGSTLLTQLLASLPQCIVMSEPPVLDAFLRHVGPDQTDNESTFQGLINALGQQRFSDEQKLFIKLDSWHLRHLSLIRKTFPHTPCLFLYRQPNEVLNSHRRQRGPQMIPGWMDATRLHLDTRPLLPTDFDGYCVKVLESFFKSALRFTLSEELILINYNQLPKIVFSQLLSFFSMVCTPSELEAIKTRAQFHAKNKNTVFTGDLTVASNQADETLRDAVNPYYDQLEQLRHKQSYFPTI